MTFKYLPVLSSAAVFVLSAMTLSLFGVTMLVGQIPDAFIPFVLLLGILLSVAAAGAAGSAAQGLVTPDPQSAALHELALSATKRGARSEVQRRTEEYAFLQKSAASVRLSAELSAAASVRSAWTGRLSAWIQFVGAAVLLATALFAGWRVLDEAAIKPPWGLLLALVVGAVSWLVWLVVVTIMVHLSMDLILHLYSGLRHDDDAGEHPQNASHNRR